MRKQHLLIISSWSLKRRRIPQFTAEQKRNGMKLDRKPTACLPNLRRNPASPVSAFVIQDRFVNYNNPMKIEVCYKLLKPGALNSTYGKQVLLIVK